MNIRGRQGGDGLGQDHESISEGKVLTVPAEQDYGDREKGRKGEGSDIPQGEEKTRSELDKRVQDTVYWMDGTK